VVTREDVLVPAAHPPEFRRRAVELAREQTKPVAELRRKNRQLEMENEILKRAAAYFARENVLPK
jgi:transposase-like protein